MTEQKSLAESKSFWRLFFKDQMNKRLKDSSELLEKNLKMNVSQFLKTQTGVWGAYHSLPGEAPAECVLEFTNTKDKTWAFPKVTGADLRFYKVTSEQDFTDGAFGIKEPLESCEQVAVSDLAGILVPGLGFDTSGTRLGRGKAFYDKTLKQYDGIKAGVAWSCQVTEDQLPKEPTDIRMDVVISERGIQWFSKKEKAQ